MKNNFRIGSGYDVHAFAENRKFIIGGVEIPFDKGLQGHSDADVLLHAIADALLGALALGDIGKHFPDSDEKYKDYDSKLLLKNVYSIILEKGYEIVNCDSTVVLQQPKLSRYIPEIRNSIASILNSEIDRVSVKATTSEHLGFVGREEGVEAFAAVLIQKA